jgi:hypothetical protein
VRGGEAEFVVVVLGHFLGDTSTRLRRNNLRPIA